MRKYGEVDIAKAYVDKIRIFADSAEGIIQNIAKNSLRECGERMNQDGEAEAADNRFTYMYV